MSTEDNTDLIANKQAHNSGRFSRLSLRPVTANPYDPGIEPQLSKAWVTGWREADDERSRLLQDAIESLELALQEAKRYEHETDVEDRLSILRLAITYAQTAPLYLGAQLDTLTKEEQKL